MPFKTLIKHNTKQKSKGQAMVEFAIVLTVMIGLFVGIFEIMTLYRKRTDLATATRMAARQASEIWIESDTDLQEEIQTYVWAELEKMGYSIDWMNGEDDVDDTDNNVTVLVESVTLETVGADLVFQTDGSTNCTYGQYIEVTLEMKWTFAVAPLDIFFDTFDPDNNTGVLKEDSLVRCWRGE